LIKLAEDAFQAGHSLEAVRLGKKALAVGGGARAHLILGGAFYDMKRLDEARASYEAVLAAEPTNQPARVGLDLSRLAIGRRPETTTTAATVRDQ
jgi:tetratricopeptide (TPR) repeat protein